MPRVSSGPSSILAGAAFRSAGLVLILFLAVFLVAGVVIVSQTSAETENEIRALVTSEFALFRDAAGDGEDQLADLVNTTAAVAGPRFFVVSLTGPDGTLLAGDDIPRPTRLGWSTISSGVNPTTPSQQYLALSEMVDGNIVTFGRTLFFVEVASAALWRALMLAGVVVAVGALAIGYVLSHGVSAKLDRMAATLAEVARGDSRARLPVGRSNDQVDRISVQMNAHLDRLSMLLDTMRNTVISIAHDLKSPLSRAYILIQQAAEERRSTAKDRLIGEAQSELERLNAIFDTVLRISRIEASDDRSSFSPFPVNGLVEEMVQIFEPVVAEAGQVLAAAPAPSDPLLAGDRRMLVQLLVNLIANASRYSPAGARITVAASEAGGEVVLRVTDTGPGIPAGRRAEVFEPFRRLNPERDEKGSGLGLALVAAIATRHRAVVELGDNAPGLRVTVRFPAGG